MAKKVKDAVESAEVVLLRSSARVWEMIISFAEYDENNLPSGSPEDTKAAFIGTQEDLEKFLSK